MKNSKVENNSRRTAPRKASGFSMLTMLALTLVVTITIVGTGSFLIPFIRSNATDALTELQARSIAESSINYGLALLNDPATRADIDVSSSQGQDDCREVTIQASDLNLPLQIAANVKGIRLYVRNDKPAAPTPPLQTDIFPLSYDPLLVAPPGTVAKFSNVNYLRTFTVLVEYGGDLNRGSYSYGAKAVVKPGLLTANDGNSPLNNSSFFTSAVAAQNSVTMGDNSRTISSDPSTPDGNIKAGGNVSVGDQAYIDGKIQSTGGQSDIQIQSGSNPTLNNQVEYISAEPTINGNPITDTTTTSQSLAPFTEGPYLSTSSTTPKSAPATNGSTYQNIPPALSAAPSTPNFASAGGSTLSGDYTINSSQLTQTNVQGLNTISSPTRLFLQNTGDINTPLEITANLGNSTSANQLQLWYNGERPLVFKGDSVNLMVYAPYSNITVGNGAKVTTFTGGIVGNNVSVSKNSTIQFAPGTSGNNFSSTAFMFDPNNASAKNTIKWQIQSVKELRYPEFVAESLLRPRKS
ncbi:MAG: hypothetical protein Q8T09_15050 [Candidatus Melainabacteria bacterium]|nr:hypothetical protein [Candidatus Melainabacteria bacterium]